MITDKFHNFGNAREDVDRLYKYTFAYTDNGKIYLGKCYATSKDEAMKYMTEEEDENIHVMRHNKLGYKTL